MPPLARRLGVAPLIASVLLAGVVGAIDDCGAAGPSDTSAREGSVACSHCCTRGDDRAPTGQPSPDEEPTRDGDDCPACRFVGMAWMSSTFADVVEQRDLYDPAPVLQVVRTAAVRGRRVNRRDVTS